MKTICIFGDSIVWGAEDKEKGGWINRLKLDFAKKEQDYEVEVYNLGISGDNTKDLLQRFLPEAKARVPNIIIFAVGINDSANEDSKQRTSLRKFEENLVKLIKEAKTFTNKIIFLGLTSVDDSKTTPVAWNKSLHYITKSAEQYNNIMKKAAKENKVLYLDLFGLLTKTDLEDGLHPNSKGHQKIFLKVRSLLLNNKLL